MAKPQRMYIRGQSLTRRQKFGLRLCKDCGRPFPPRNGKHKRCSECGQAANRQNAAKRSAAYYDNEMRRPRPKPKPRTCLMCGREFSSWGPGNRRCPTCDKRNLTEGVSDLRVARICSGLRVLSESSSEREDLIELSQQHFVLPAGDAKERKRRHREKKQQAQMNAKEEAKGNGHCGGRISRLAKS